MLNLILTKDNISNEYEINNNLNKNLLDNTNTLVFQDTEKTMIFNFEENSNNSFTLFSKITDMIVTSEFQSVNQLKTYFDTIKTNDTSALDDLQLLLQKSNFTYEIISTIETEAGNEDLSDSSTFSDNFNLTNSTKHNLINRYKLAFEDENINTSSSDKSDVPVPLGITGITRDTGLSSNDYITSDNTLTIYGTGPISYNIKITIDGLVLKTTVDSSGNWKVSNEDIILVDGDYIITAEILDDFNNTLDITTQNITIDTLPTNAPTITNVLDVNSNLSQILMSGTGSEIGNTIRLYDASNNLIATTSVLSDNTWSVDIASISKNFNHIISAVEVDTAGNESLKSSSTAVYINNISQYLTLTGEEDYYFNANYTAILYNNNDDDNNFLVFDAGGGWHSLDFRGNAAAININLAGDTITIGDDIVEIKNLDIIIGTIYGDTITANDKGNVISSWDGNDKIYGGAGEDKINAGAGEDSIEAGDGNDRIFAGDNSDLITGGKGDDLIWGGTNNLDSGMDTAVYSGTFAEYSFIKYSPYFEVIDSISNRDGTDQINLVEYLQFTDQIVSTAIFDNPSIGLLSSSDSGSNTSDNISNALTPTVQVSLVPGIDPGHKIFIYVDSVKVFTYTILPGDVSNTYANIQIPALSSDDTYEIQASFVNLLSFEGNKSTSSLSYTLDTIADDVSLSLNTDTGTNTSDNITSDPQINIDNLEATSTWQYSTNGGVNWTTDSGNSFNLSSNTTYNVNDIQVKVTDIAGNESIKIMSNSVTTYTNSVTAVDDTGTGAFNFDAINYDYIDVGNIAADDGFYNASSVYTGFTFSANITYDSFESWSRIMDFSPGGFNNDNITIANKATNGTLIFGIFDANIASSVQISNFFTIGTSVNLTITQDASGTVSIYKDSVLVSQTTLNLPQNVDYIDNFLGQSYYDSNAATHNNANSFDGEIDNIIILSRALTQTEITNSFTNGNDSLNNDASLLLHMDSSQSHTNLATSSTISVDTSNMSNLIYEDTTAIIDVLANDSDLQGDSFSITSVQDATNGTAVLNGDQTVSFTPSANYSGVATFTYTITDADGATDTATVTLNVVCTSTPLVLDLDEDGVETISSNNGVYFDIDADGDKDLTGWVAADDGLLVRDINNDGIINDASELFGEETVKEDGTKAVDGFDALRELDSNNDGLINSQDEAYNELQVWQDLNSDGFTDEGELISLEEAGVSEISLDATKTNKVDNGNIIGLESSYTNKEGQTSDISDVWFSYTQNENISLDNVKNSTLNLNNSKNDIVAINFDQLLDVLDDNNELIILGDDEDSLILEGGIKTDDEKDGKWELISSKEDEKGTTYNVYESKVGESSVKLLIEDNIDISNI